MNIRGIDDKIHDSFEYALLNFYLSEEFKDNAVLAHFKTEVHLISDLKANVLIEMNIMSSEEMILNFKRKIMIISICDDFETSIFIKRREQSMNRAVRIASQITISAEKVMTISVRIRDDQISRDRDYSFFLKTNKSLESEEEFFAHITKAKITIVQIRNTSNKLYFLLKNYKIDHLKDFAEKKCYLTSSQNRHLVIESTKQASEIMKALKTSISLKFMKTVLSNEVTVYEDESTINRIVTVVNEYSNI
jgi:hypothetical protein